MSDGEEALANNFSFSGIIEPKKNTASLMKPNCAKQTLYIIISVSDAIRFNELLKKFTQKKTILELMDHLKSS